ncbi:MAG: serine hydrolase domain-containing protein [Bacteroidota bacterium]
MKHYLLLVIIAVALLGYIIFPQTSEAEEERPFVNPHQAALLKDYEAFLQQSSLPGMAIAIVRDTSIIYLKGFGQKAMGHPGEVDVNTVFRIGSLSKGFAAALAALLEEEDQLNWDDLLVTHLPDFKLKSAQDSRQLTVEHLLSHSSGLPYHTYTNLVEAGQNSKQIIQALADIKLNATPGTQYSYQNAIYSLIDPILARRSGQPFDELMRRRLFQPLGMKEASTSYEGIAGHGNKALPHRRAGGRWQPAQLTTKYYNAIAAGGINASISDMAQWLQALLGNRPDVLNKAVLDDLFTPRIKTPIKARYFSEWPQVEQSYYALGWRILDYDGETVVYHGGFVNNFRSEIAINRKEKIGICVLINAPGRFTKRCIPEFLNRYKQRRDSILVAEQQDPRLLK